MFNKYQKASILGMGFAAAMLMIPDGTGITSGDKKSLASLYYGDASFVGTPFIDLRSNVITSSNTLIITRESTTPEMGYSSTTLKIVPYTTTPTMVATSTTLRTTLSSNTPEITIIQ
jgi:hypothetical protein